MRREALGDLEIAEAPADLESAQAPGHDLQIQVEGASHQERHEPADAPDPAKGAPEDLVVPHFAVP